MLLKWPITLPSYWKSKVLKGSPKDKAMREGSSEYRQWLIDGTDNFLRDIQKNPLLAILSTASPSAFSEIDELNELLGSTERAYLSSKTLFDVIKTQTYKMRDRAAELNFKSVSTVVTTDSIQSFLLRLVAEKWKGLEEMRFAREGELGSILSPDEQKRYIDKYPGLFLDALIRSQSQDVLMGLANKMGEEGIKSHLKNLYKEKNLQRMNGFTSLLLAMQDSGIEPSAKVAEIVNKFQSANSDQKEALSDED